MSTKRGWLIVNNRKGLNTIIHTGIALIAEVLKKDTLRETILITTLLERNTKEIERGYGERERKKRTENTEKEKKKKSIVLWSLTNC